MLKIAHRGASGYEPENTLAAFHKALEMHVDMIELDVRLCKSGEPVIMHDAKINRTTNGEGKLADLTLAELKKLNAGKGEKIPTLEEVLTLLGKKVKLNLNIKEKNVIATTVTLITRYVKEGKLDYGDVVIASPNVFYLRKIKQLNPSINVSVIMRYLPAIHTRISYKLRPFSVQPHKRVMNKKFVQKAHREGMKVFTWTLDEGQANEQQYIQKMKTLGVDGIISNYPDKI